MLAEQQQEKKGSFLKWSNKFSPTAALPTAWMQTLSKVLQILSKVLQILSTERTLTHITAFSWDNSALSRGMLLNDESQSSYKLQSSLCYMAELIAPYSRCLGGWVSADLWDFCTSVSIFTNRGDENLPCTLRSGGKKCYLKMRRIILLFFLLIPIRKMFV